MDLTILRRNAKPGDVLVNFVTGKDYFRVDSVHPARARGYVVLLGQYLVPTDGSGTQTSGHGLDEIRVRRNS